MANSSDIKEFIYKTADGRDLIMYGFYPDVVSDADPCVLCIHGGGWERENPSVLFRHAEYFASCGFIALCPEYRLMQKGGNILPCLEDCIDAALFVKSNAKKLKVDEYAVNVLGESAGGYLACCLGCEKIIKRIRPDSSPVACKVIDVNGITDLTGYWKYALCVPNERNSAAGFSESFDMRFGYSPVYNVSESDAPTYIMHGLNDTVVDPEDSLRYAKALENVGVACKVDLIPGAKHAFILFGFDMPDEKIYPLLYRIVGELKS